MSEHEQTKTSTAVDDATPTGVRANGEPTDAGSDLAALIAERDEYLDQLQRSRADFANFRRRTEQERMQVREIANRALLSQLLPVVDDFARALEAIPAEQRETPWVQGMDLIDRKLWGVLERQGVTPIEALGQPFDPAQHEAIATDAGSGADTVVDVFQTGYRLGETLLRPAMVKLGSNRSVATGANGTTDDVESTEQHGEDGPDSRPR